MTVLLDTGPLVALLNGDEEPHEWAVRQAHQLEPPLLTCEAVLSEAHFLLQHAPRGRRRLIELMDTNRIDVAFSYSGNANRVNALMHKYADLPMAFADACLVCMSELYDDSRVFTVDSDFRVYQQHGTEPVPVLIPEE